MELKELQEKVDEWIKSYGVRYFNELTNMTILTEEVGELARVMARKYGKHHLKCNINQMRYRRRIWTCFIHFNSMQAKPPEISNNSCMISTKRQ